MGLNFRSLPVLTIPGDSITSQFYGQKSSHMDSPSGFTRIFIFHEKIYAAHEATWSVEDWTPYLKITWEGRYSITLHNLSCIFVMTLCKIYSFARNAEKSNNNNASKILGNETLFLIILRRFRNLPKNEPSGFCAPHMDSIFLKMYAYPWRYLKLIFPYKIGLMRAFTSEKKPIMMTSEWLICPVTILYRLINWKKKI